MHTVWIRLRRLVASAMLVAMASFVLHGGAMAGMHQHSIGAQDCGTHASYTSHVHVDTDDHHGSDAGHPHEGGEAQAHHGDDGHESASAEPCCGSVCSIAIATTVPDAAWALVSAPIVHMLDATFGPDNRPEGLKRPPRTPDIA